MNAWSVGKLGFQNGRCIHGFDYVVPMWCFWKNVLLVRGLGGLNVHLFQWRLLATHQMLFLDKYCRWKSDATITKLGWTLCWQPFSKWPLGILEKYISNHKLFLGASRVFQVAPLPMFSCTGIPLVLKTMNQLSLPYWFSKWPPFSSNFVLFWGYHYLVFCTVWTNVTGIAW